jgi:DNA-directed RNA polymerase sigma subunit (sigma70/sigma32)
VDSNAPDPLHDALRAASMVVREDEIPQEEGRDLEDLRSTQALREAILELRFGLDTGEGCTLEEVGKELGLTSFSFWDCAIPGRSSGTLA